MKLYFAAAAAIALFASAPSQAASVMSAGSTVQEECFRAAQSQARAPLSLRSLGNGIAAGNDTAAIADFDAGLARNIDLAAGYMNRGSALLRAARYTEARADFDRAI